MEAITFNEMTQFAVDSGAEIVNNMPWSFEYKGHQITHENDECYLIPTLEGVHNMTPEDMLITGVQGEIYPCKLDIFKQTYSVSAANSEQEVEKEIKEKGLTAPRLTPELIDSAIADKTFHVFDTTCLTVCCLTLNNGFTVTGESACASPENFNQEIGEKIAFEQARNKVWMLEGYLLKQKLFETSNE